MTAASPLHLPAARRATPPDTAERHLALQRQDAVGLTGSDDLMHKPSNVKSHWFLLTQPSVPAMVESRHATLQPGDCFLAVGLPS